MNKSKKWATITALVAAPLGLTLVACSSGSSSSPTPNAQSQSASTDTRQAGGNGGNERTQAPIRIYLKADSPELKAKSNRSSFQVGDHPLKPGERFNIVLDRDLQMIRIQADEQCSARRHTYSCSYNSTLYLKPHWDSRDGYTQVDVTGSWRGAKVDQQIRLGQWTDTENIGLRPGGAPEGSYGSRDGDLSMTYGELVFVPNQRTKELTIDFYPVYTSKK